MAKILVADDNPQICRAMERVLRGAGHKVVAAEKVGDATRLLALDRPGNQPFEVIIVDLSFDNYDGPDAKAEAGMQIVQAALVDPFAEIIVLTGFGTTRTAADACAKGVFRYIEKGADPEVTLKDYILAVVADAVIMRRKLQDLSTSLHVFSNILSEARRSGLDKEVANRGQEILRQAEEVYSTILRYRGKHA